MVLSAGRGGSIFGHFILTNTNRIVSYLKIALQYFDFSLVESSPSSVKMSDEGSEASGGAEEPRQFLVERLLTTGAFGFVWECSFGTESRVVVKFTPGQNIEARNEEKNTPTFELASDVANAVMQASAHSSFVASLTLGVVPRHLRYAQSLSNGNLFGLADKGPLSVDTMRLFAAEAFLAMTALHSAGMLHRHLALESVGIHDSGHIRLHNFDHCIFPGEHGTVAMPTNSPVTCAPETFMRQTAKFEPDFWSFGVLLLELLGQYPYYEIPEDELVRRVCTHGIPIPEEHRGSSLGELLQGLLAVNKDDRLDEASVRSHPFFTESLRWEDVSNQQHNPLEAWLSEAENTVGYTVRDTLPAARTFSNTTALEVVEATEHHPFLIHYFFDIPEAFGRRSFMEYLGNGDLFKLASRGALSVETLRIFAAEIFLGLAALHNAGFVHRDLKLENVGISTSGHIRLFDFDMCHRFADAEETVTTESGTLTSSAPECLLREPARFEPDFWAFGIMLLELLGHYPFDGLNTDDIVRRICTEAIRIPLEHRRTNLGGLLRGLLTIDKEQRFDQERVRTHPFFEGEYSWESVLNLEVNPLEAWLEEAENVEEYAIDDEDLALSEMNKFTEGVDTSNSRNFQFR